MHIFNIVVVWLQLHSVIGMTGVFALLVLATYWPGRRAAIERNASIPLQDDR